MSTHTDLSADTLERLLAQRDWLRALARSLVHDDARADDLVQDTWLTALRRPPDDLRSPRAWLRTVARNLVHDRHRTDTARRRREEGAARPDEVPDTTGSVARAELQSELTRHVLALDEPYRTTVILRYFESLPPRGVAARMGVPVETVRTRNRRALERLRERLEEEHGGAAEWRTALLPLTLAGPGGRSSGAPVAIAVTAFVAAIAVSAWLLGSLGGTPDVGEPPRHGDTAGSTAPGSPAVAPAQPAPEDHEPSSAAPSTPERGEHASETPDDDAAGTSDAGGAEPPVSQPSTGPRLHAPNGVSLGDALVATLPATGAQPIGMDPAEIRAFLADVGWAPGAKRWGNRFDFVWEQGFLFYAPRHTVPVPAVEIARFECTNAQWRVFLDDPVNAQQDDVVSGDVTLKVLVKAIYGIDADELEHAPDAQRAGLYLYHRNAERLAPEWNPDGREDFDPLRAYVEDEKIPAGTTIAYSAVLPPPYWKGGEIPENELDKPVRYLSWDDARRFCRWAGLHLPTEAEWERAARGGEGRRFPWGDTWDRTRCVWKHWKTETEIASDPEPVDALPEGATPEGVHHLLGNVSEYVFDIARRYEGSPSRFAYDGAGLLARGGCWADEPYVLNGADRIWDVGSSQIGPATRADGFGFRWAAYPTGGRDLALELATYSTESFRIAGPATWLPYPPGLSAKDREKRDKRLPLQGFAIDRTAGFVVRDVDPSAPHHAAIRGPADGLAFLPVKGLLGTYLKDKGRLAALARDDDETALVGALLATDGAVVHLVDAEGRRVDVDMGPGNRALWTTHDLGFTYQVGAWLVLRDDRVAVYPGNGSESGVFGAHLRGAPLGWLPEPYEHAWAITDETHPTGRLENGIATLTAPIPQLEKDGTPKRAGKCIRLTLRVPITFRD